MTALGYVGALLYGMVCLIISSVLYKAGVPKRYTRKTVHIMVGFEWVILYHTLGVGIHFVAVCLVFTALLVISYKKSLMPMISSDGDNAPGTVYYGVSMTAMALICCFLDNFVFAFGIAVFCTSIGDGMAGIFGSMIKAYNPRIYKSKTLMGTIAALVFSFLSIYLFSLIYDLNIGIFEMLAISFFAAGLELITGRGLDNITIPLGTAFLSYFLLYVEGTLNYIVPIVLTPFVICFALEKKVLSKKGVLIALILDMIVSVSLKNFGFVLLLAFLVLSVIADKIKKRLKQGHDEISKKSDERDGIQVLANGLIPLICAILYFFTRKFVFIVGYNVALAECFADTIASSIGSLSKRAFDPFKMKFVPVGLSGGMSIFGTLSSLISPFVFLLISIAFGVIDFKIWILSSLMAFLGAILDSLLGSLMQSKYKCENCGIITEKTEHCNKNTVLVSGLRFMTNDTVNLISCGICAAAAMIFYIIII